MQTVLKKLFYKGQAPVLVLHAPQEAQALVAALGPEIQLKVKGKANFILAFAVDQKAAQSIANAAPKFLDEAAVFWMAYPKGSSKKYKADIHRDTLRELVEKAGFDTVSLIALDDDWSAMRLKKLAR